MAKRVHVLSDQLARDLPQIVAAVRRQIQGDLRDNERPTGQAPDDVWVMTPVNGIPARSDLTAQSELCDAYRWTDNGDDTLTAEQILDGYGDPLQYRTYNTWTTDCPGEVLVPTARMRNGRRYVLGWDC